MSTEPLRVVLAGGGTAGHVSPLLAIAGAVKSLRPDAELLAVGTAGGMEARLVPESGYELATIDRVPMPRTLSRDLLKLPFRFLRAVKQSAAVLERARADVVVGVGGYVCTPVYIAARMRRIPLVIHEANARPGLANRVGARMTGRVAVAFEATDLPGARWVGMPMRAQISALDRSIAQSEARRGLGLRADSPVIVVTGGSSGAANINRAIAHAWPDLSAAGIQVLHITGKGKIVLDGSGEPLSGGGYQQVEYVDGMEAAYAAADLLVARAGAGTVSEVSAVGLPSVLVPLAHGNGEQALNAAALVAAGGAMLVADHDFTPDWIRTHLLPLLAEPEGLTAMSRAASSLGIRDAAERMARLVLEAAGSPGFSNVPVEDAT